ncbi:MAG TPA: phytanoyl-CoA dioxygenase family protein, partial [Acidimicrobiales bacterium]|nr:phytanoyl-CoA dioxygenase family protein [Acidimicrobiales bacterium]
MLSGEELRRFGDDGYLVVPGVVPEALLTAVDDEVWPGSHLVHQRLFHKRGTRALTGVGGHVLSLDDPPALRPRVEVTARRGDLLLAHFLLGHNTGGNTTDRVRRIAYYRLSCPGHAE